MRAYYYDNLEVSRAARWHPGAATPHRLSPGGGISGR